MINEASSRPRERLLRRDEVMRRVGLRTTAIYKRMHTGQFPKGVLLGARCRVWPESEIDAWVRDTVARAGAPNG